jgi:hypothetical protein
MARLTLKKYTESQSLKVSKTMKLQPVKAQKSAKQWQNIAL